jgi:hypothetical protein
MPRQLTFVHSEVKQKEGTIMANKTTKTTEAVAPVISKRESTLAAIAQAGVVYRTAKVVSKTKVISTARNTGEFLRDAFAAFKGVEYVTPTTDETIDES